MQPPSAPNAARNPTPEYLGWFRFEVFHDGAFAPNGKHLITVCIEATAVMWEATDWTETVTFAWDIGPLIKVCGHHHGRQPSGIENGGFRTPDALRGRDRT